MLLRKISLILCISLILMLFMNKSSMSGQINFTEEMVKNISIPDQGADEGEMINFKDGYFRFGEGAQDPEYRFGGMDMIALGDLTGEGANDAAFIYWESVGTGKSYAVCVVSGKNGKIATYDGPFLGNFVKVNKFFISEKKLIIDAIFQEKGLGNKPVTINDTYVLKNNKLIAVKSNNKKAGYKSEPAVTATSNSNKSLRYDENIIGKWYGEFSRANANGTKYKYTMTFYIFKNPQNASELLFQEEDTMKFDSIFSVNSCTNKNLSHFAYKGRIERVGDNYNFIQLNTEVSKCCSLGVQILRFTGATIEIINAENGRMTTGTLRKIN